MNIRPAKLEWLLSDPVIHSDDLPHCLILGLAANSCGEAYINPHDHNMGFLFFDSHYIQCLRDAIKKNDWYGTPTEHQEQIAKLGKTIIEYIDQHPSLDGTYCFLASDEF